VRDSTIGEASTIHLPNRSYYLLLSFMVYHPASL
jgi:hypothetical protein